MAPGELVREALAAFGRRDVERLAELMDPAVEIDLTGRVLNPATYSGLEGVERLLGEIAELWESIEMLPERLLERSDEVLVVVRTRMRGRGSGVELDAHVAQHWKTRDGRIVHVRLHRDVEGTLAEWERAARAATADSS